MIKKTFYTLLILFIVLITYLNYFGISTNKLNQNIGTNNVLNTNYCDISICSSENKVIILCAIDNLIKGGSGQAVQNFNKFFNFKETLGFK